MRALLCCGRRHAGARRHLGRIALATQVRCGPNHQRFKNTPLQRWEVWHGASDRYFWPSLGGGYALLSALELFARGQDADGFLIDPAAVVTFGAPMVIVPGVKKYFWQTLHARAVVVINAWDACPRTPSCEAWMFDVLPSVSVRTRMLSNKTVVEQALRPVWGTVSRYDACGTLCFVDAVRPGKVHI